jgi:hypothetical protein
MLTSSKVREMLSSGLIKDAEQKLAERNTDSGSGLLSISRGQVAVMKQEWDEAQRHLDNAERAAISAGRQDDLESALLLGSNVAYQRGDFETAARLAARAEEVLGSSGRQDRLAWSLVLQFRARSTLRRDTSDLTGKLSRATVAYGNMPPALARQTLVAVRTPEAYVVVLRCAMQSPVSGDLLRALVGVLSAWYPSRSRTMPEALVILRSSVDKLLSSQKSKVVPESTPFERMFQQLLAFEKYDDELMAQFGSAFAQASEIPVFGVSDA